MYCGKCGHQNVDNSSFCAICGNKLNQQVATSYAANPVSQAKDMNRVSKSNKSGNNMTGKVLFAVIGLAVGIAIGIGLFVILNSGSSGSSGKYEGKGFSTPEDAATAYIEAYGDGDIDKLVSCFAVESSVENYEMADMLERFESYFPSATIKMPNYGETSKKLNIENKRADIIKTIIQHYVVSQSNAGGGTRASGRRSRRAARLSGEPLSGEGRADRQGRGHAAGVGRDPGRRVPERAAREGG